MTSKYCNEPKKLSHNLYESRAKTQQKEKFN